MEVEVEPLLFGLKGNDAVFANGATYDTGSFGSKTRFREFISKKIFINFLKNNRSVRTFFSSTFKYDKPLGDANQVISIVNDTLSVFVDFEVIFKI